MRLRIRILATVLAALLGLGAPIAGPVGPAAAANEVKLVVNNIPITSYDIARRAALLRLQHKTGNLRAQARQDMIDQALEKHEIQRYHVDVTDAEVNTAFDKFASSNHLSASQLSSILNRAGVTADHFKDYIRVQMGWGRVLQQRYQVSGMITEQEAVQRILKDGGVKPKTTEYTLQQIIFVIPSKQMHALLAKRRREAEALRPQISDCNATRKIVLSKGLIDVTVRDLGRVLEPTLPPDWAKLIKATSAGHTTKLRDTNRGVEFIAVCKTREVSDDRVAQLVFSAEDTSGEKKVKEMRDDYIKELRKKAHIETR